jgi:hypothetical protein
MNMTPSRPRCVSWAMASKDAHITDDFGKELDTLHGAYVHARKLIDKILFRVGDDDAEALGLPFPSLIS